MWRVMSATLSASAFCTHAAGTQYSTTQSTVMPGDTNRAPLNEPFPEFPLSLVSKISSDNPPCNPVAPQFARQQTVPVLPTSPQVHSLPAQPLNRRSDDANQNDSLNPNNRKRQASDQAEMTWKQSKVNNHIEHEISIKKRVKKTFYPTGFQRIGTASSIGDFRDWYEHLLKGHIEGSLHLDRAQLLRLWKQLGKFTETGGFGNLDLTQNVHQFAKLKGWGTWANVRDHRSEVDCVDLARNIGGQIGSKRWKIWFGHEKDDGIAQHMDEAEMREFIRLVCHEREVILEQRTMSPDHIDHHPTQDSRPTNKVWIHPVPLISERQALIDFELLKLSHSLLISQQYMAALLRNQMTNLSKPIPNKPKFHYRTEFNLGGLSSHWPFIMVAQPFHHPESNLPFGMIAVSDSLLIWLDSWSVETSVITIHQQEYDPLVVESSPKNRIQVAFDERVIMVEIKIGSNFRIVITPIGERSQSPFTENTGQSGINQYLVNPVDTDDPVNDAALPAQSRERVARIEGEAQTEKTEQQKQPEKNSSERSTHV